MPAPRPDPRWLAPALLAAGIALSGVTARNGILPNDEGLMLQAAARIAGGEVPYGDFWWFYPPGQPYLLAGLQELLGPSLVTWRVVRVLADATVAVLAFLLARRRSSRNAALAAWLVAACAMAWPGGPHPFPLALAFSLGALLVLEARPAVAGVLAGACAAWRLEFAAFLVAGAALGLLTRSPRRPVLRLLGAAAATAAVLYAPVVVAAGAAPAWDLLVDYPLTDFRDYQTLPFPLDYDGPLNTSSLGGFLDDSLEPLLLFHLPLVLVAGLIGGLAALRELTPLTVATAVLALGMLAYLLVRTDVFHTAPLAVLVGILGAWAVTEGRRLPAAVCALALAYAAVEGVDRRWLGLREDVAALDLPVGDGVRVRPRQAAELEAAVQAAQRLVPPGRPLYVTGRRADLVTAGHPLFYVLAGRRNPTRYDIAAPGVVTSAAVQREIVAALERTRTPLVVRWTDPSTAAPEPNAAGRSSGVRLLDAFLARRYRPADRLGAFELLVRRP